MAVNGVPQHEGGYAVVHRWRVRPGYEDLFVEGWTRVAHAAHRFSGGYGSRLHRAEDGVWMSYARWPDKEAGDRGGQEDAEGAAMMSVSVEESLPVMHLEIVADLLAEPGTTAG
ncbi:hypothetical protein GCM10009830_48180 [Glycomyces endophyticus]|uniref:ABM domain-containing protein n=1 Tax=Glycomyces endophyticus TaxID=480996 RepID=A0ABP4TVN1_9ACTN